MDEFKQLFKSPIALITIIGAFIIGALVGLVILGWGLFPVEWTDAEPSDLRADAKVSYLRACIDAYGYNGDATRANGCYASLGDSAGQALADIVQNPGTQDRKLVAAFGSIALAQPGQAPAGLAETVAAATGVPAPGETIQPLPAEEVDTGGTSGMTLLIIFVLLALVGGAVYLVLRFFRRRQPDSQPQGNQSKSAQPTSSRTTTSEDAPFSQALATYQYGNDLFDEVFSVEASGEFLGEYGVAIVDASGVGGPKKVSAFEIWLFDKADPTTTTKVLLSDHTVSDPAKRKSLEAKGDLETVENLLGTQNGVVILETKTLHLEARILEVNFGQSSTGSYFERLGLDLAVWPLE